MMVDLKQVERAKVSFVHVLQLVFVVFCLYLTGDAFFRWDGFRYYASFSEFLPSVSLIAIFWSIISLLASVVVWVLIRGFEWFCNQVGWKMKTENLMFLLYAFVFLSFLVWIGRGVILNRDLIPLTFGLKSVLSASFSAVVLTWLFRNKHLEWTVIIKNRITLLTWLFGIFLMLSVPLLAYHTWLKHTDEVIPRKIPQSSVTDENPPNVIFVIFDALTARDMSVYGYHRETTPFISEWAKSATVFNKLQAGNNFTTPAVASIMTGKKVWTHQTFHLDGSRPVRSNIENLPLVMKKNSYYTMAFIVNNHATVKTLGIANSFDIAPIVTEFRKPASLYENIDAILYRLFGDKIRLYDWILKADFVLFRVIEVFSGNVSKTTVPPEIAFNKLIEIIDGNPPEPFFAWIHVFPPHAPYLPPEPFMGMFYASSRLRTDKELNEACVAGENEELKGVRARYDEFIRYCDEQFENFITELNKRGKLEDTIIILSSDHGESFEHDYIGHSGKHLYEQVTHIPLIIREPGKMGGRIVRDVVEQIDIPATILDIAGIPVPSWMEGRSLVPLMRGKSLQPRPAFSMNFQKNPSRGHQITKGTIAVWEGDYKLIYYLEENESLLFNLKEDSDELKNLIDREPEVGMKLLSIIKGNLEKANERINNEKYQFN